MFFSKLRFYVHAISHVRSNLCSNYFGLCQNYSSYSSLFLHTQYKVYYLPMQCDVPRSAGRQTIENSCETDACSHRIPNIFGLIMTRFPNELHTHTHAHTCVQICVDFTSSKMSRFAGTSLLIWLDNADFHKSTFF